MNRTKIAIVRGKFMNKCEMQSFEHLTKHFDIRAFGSLTSFHTEYKFPVTKLLSPIDIPEFPYKMQILNRLTRDAHYLFGLENNLKGYDIAHTAESYYHYTQQCLNAKKKGLVKVVVATVYENIPHANEGIWGRKMFKNRSHKEIDLFLATTNDSKNALIKEGVDSKKIKVIHSGVDTKRFRPVKKYSKNLNILFVGRLEKFKGIYNVIDSFLYIHSKFNKVNLTIVGKGSEELKLKKIIKNNNIEKKVRFKSIPYDKIHKVYQQADIFIAPSVDTDTWKEQFGYVFIEAMASGLPIITTDAGSIPEVVNNSAVIVSQDNKKELTQKLSKLVNSKEAREELGNKARSHAVKYYDSRIIAKKLNKLYKELI